MRDDGVDRERLLGLLAEVLRREDDGEELDVLALCDGDAELAARLTRLKGLEPSLAKPDDGQPARERLGDFEILAPLGHGGMGRVFIAEQMSLKRLVALKVIDPAFGNDRRAAARFRREAEIAASLDHPNIVPIYAIGAGGGGDGNADGRLYIAMKWLSGPGLDECESLLPREVARIGAGVARGLHEAHRSGIIHRDVKPANIIMNGGEPVVVDFGLAKSAGDFTATFSGRVAGTLQYLAPEQLESRGAALDPRLDVYGLGATLYELLAGRPPLEAESQAALVQRILMQEPPRIGLRGSDRDLETIVIRCLAKRPEHRFATAAELAEDLDRYLAGRPILSSRPGPLVHALRLVSRHRRAASVVGLSAFVTLVLAATLAVKSASRRAAFAAELDAVRESIAAERLDAATAQLRTLERGDGGSATLATVARELDRARALQTLLDTLLEKKEGQSPRFLRGLLAQLAGDANRPAAAPLESAAKVLAKHLLGDDAAARDELANARRISGGGLAVDSLDALLRSDPDWMPPAAGAGAPGSSGASADEHVIACIALRLMNRDLAIARSEGEAALHAAPGNYRAQCALCVLEVEEAEREEDVIAGYRRAIHSFELVRRQGESRPTVLRNLARLHVLLGEFDESRRLQDELRREHPEVFGPYDVYFAAFASWAQGDRDGFERELPSRRTDEWANAPILLLLEAQCQHRSSEVAEERGDAAAAAEHARAAMASLDRARRNRDSLDVAELVDATRLKFDTAALESRSSRLDGDPVATAAWARDRDAALQTSNELLAALVTHRARSIASWSRARILAWRGEYPAALETISTAIAADPADPSLRRLYCDLATQWIVEESDYIQPIAGSPDIHGLKLDGPFSDVARRALDQYAALNRHVGAGDAFAFGSADLESSRTRVLDCGKEATLALSLGDRDRAVAAARKGLELIEKGGSDGLDTSDVEPELRAVAALGGG